MPVSEANVWLALEIGSYGSPLPQTGPAQPSRQDQLKAWSQAAQMMDDASLSYCAHLFHKQPQVLTDLQTKHEVFLLSALESHRSYRGKLPPSLPHLGKGIKIRCRDLVIVTHLHPTSRSHNGAQRQERRQEICK